MGGIRIDAWTDLAEIGGVLCEAFRQGGYTAVVCGRAALAIYLEDASRTREVAFRTDASKKATEQLLGKNGFVFREQEGVFRHADTEIVLVRSSRFLNEGALPIRNWEERKTKFGTVYLADYVSCVMERLLSAALAESGEGLDECIREAAALTGKFSVPVGAVRKWADAEGLADVFEAFSVLLGRDYRKQDLGWKSVQKL